MANKDINDQIKGLNEVRSLYAELDGIIAGTAGGAAASAELKI